MSKLDGVPPADVGERLRLAREGKGLRQAEAADSIEVGRTTLVAIEKGQRRIRLNELQQLARLYDTTVNALLRHESVLVDLAPRFRKLPGSEDAATAEAVQLMSNLARAEVELENLLGVSRPHDLPPERPIMPGDVKAQAEHNATELRGRLGLGMSPIPDVVTLLEMEMGVRVYIRRVDSRISGLFAYDDALGACMLLNANHPRTRRTQSAGHECGHLVSTRRKPEVLHFGEVGTSREERYADAFGRAFLTPARAVMQKFAAVTAGSDRLTRRHVIVLAYFFGVSREAMVRRLEELRLVKGGTWDWFVSQGGITDAQERQVLGDLQRADSEKAGADRPTTLRLSLLAAGAYRKGLLSEGQLARLLHLDRIEVYEIFDGLETEESEADGVPKLPD